MKRLSCLVGRFGVLPLTVFSNAAFAAQPILATSAFVRFFEAELAKIGESGWLSSLVLILAMVSGAFANMPDFEPRVVIYTPDEPVKIGETTRLTAKIFFINGWKSAKITFASSNDLVQIDEIVLGEGGHGYEFYIPVTINAEGRYDFKGTITVEAKEGELFENGETTWTKRTSNFGAFAFEGEVFFGSNSDVAMGKVARRNLMKSNPEYANLIAKKESVKTRAMSSTLSEDDKAKMKKLFDESFEQINKKYYDKYPLPKSPSSFLRSSPTKPRKGDTVDLRVNFPTNNDYAKFLPLDGAQITIFNNIKKV